MTTFNTSWITVRAAVAGLALFGASQSMAQTISGQVTDWVSNGGYAANIKNLTFSQGGTAAYGGTGVVVCIDPFTEFPAPPATHHGRKKGGGGRNRNKCPLRHGYPGGDDYEISGR